MDTAVKHNNNLIIILQLIWKVSLIAVGFFDFGYLDFLNSFLYFFRLMFLNTHLHFIFIKKFTFLWLFHLMLILKVSYTFSYVIYNTIFYYIRVTLGKL